MRSLRRLRKLWNDVLDGLEAAVLAWTLRSALERHKPAMIDRWEHQNSSGGIWADPMFAEPWCLTCVAHWPCERWEEVAGLAEKLDIDGS